MKKFLVGTDFSKGSDLALAKACELAQCCGAEVHLLHILALVDDPGSEDPETREFYANLSTAAEGKMAAQIQRAKTDLPIVSQLKIGSRPQMMLEAARTLAADLIFMGSRPLTSESGRLSVSHRLALTSNVPILLVPEELPDVES